MKLATKQFASVKEVKESLKKGGGGKGWIKNIPADGLTVRFLGEPETWFGYFEYWTGEGFCPMTEGEILPDGAKASFRYLVSAVDTETDQVIALKLPKTAANSLMLKYEKYGTVTDRDYELDKHGAGLDTTYEVTPCAPAAAVLEKYEPIDLEGVLVDARRQSLGEEEAGPFDSADVDNVNDEDFDLDEMSKKQLRQLFDSVRGSGSSDGLSRSEMVDVLVDELER
jgi:hypothetical protein